MLVMLLRFSAGFGGAHVVTRVVGPSGPALTVAEPDWKNDAAVGQFVVGLVSEAAAASAKGALPDAAALLSNDGTNAHAGDNYAVYIAVSPLAPGELPAPGNAYARAVAMLIEY